MSKTIDKACWICKEKATTGEHLIKKSDLLGIFGKPSQGTPLFLHNAEKKNQMVQGLNANSLKIHSVLCAKCNNERTQVFDRAWETTSNYLRNKNLQIQTGSTLRGNRVFPYNTKRNLRDTQLYFVKLFGCLIHANKIPINLDGFANSILERTFHPNICIKFGRFLGAEKMVGVAGLSTLVEKKSDEVVLSHWFYELGEFAINVIYAKEVDAWESTKTGWLPQKHTSCFRIHDFSKDLARE